MNQNDYALFELLNNYDKSKNKIIINEDDSGQQSSGILQHQKLLPIQ